jgi:hypothetical protein
MSGAQNSNDIYGPAAQLVQNGASAHVSPYNNVARAAAPASNLQHQDFPRDHIGRFTPR